MQHQAARVVYASTLSSFPPRPPLKPRAPELSPAAQIIADYRAQHGTLTPSVRSLSLEAPESAGNAALDSSSTCPPAASKRMDLGTETMPQEQCAESPASTRSSASDAARLRFAYSDPTEHRLPDTALAAGGESDTSTEDESVVVSPDTVERSLRELASKRA